mmetsp:Transcript_14718/g.41128  ORF Transcript_14718/g.41128 Transcript_14718/m.41128 type:complete len:104 (+) Transcript_14718:121-432(+)
MNLGIVHRCCRLVSRASILLLLLESVLGLQMLVASGMKGAAFRSAERCQIFSILVPQHLYLLRHREGELVLARCCFAALLKYMCEVFKSAISEDPPSERRTGA